MQKSVFIQRGVKFVFHLLFWVLVYFFYTYFLGYGSQNTEYVNLFSFFLMPVTMIVSYLFFSYFIPQFLLKGKQNKFLLYTIYTFIVSFFFINVSIFYALVFLADYRVEGIIPLTKTLLFIILGVYFIILIVIVTGLVIHNLKSIVKNEELKAKFLEAELKLNEQKMQFLKMQIHPHFLFNSLNTIYGYTLKKSDEAPEMVLKLSNLLDYILYQVDKPTVFLQDEINHLKDYVELEKMRFHDTLQVDFIDKVGDSTMQIAPMLLIPFVENSFKHGAILNGKLSVKIVITLSSDELHFLIENSAKNINKTNAGIGLENINKRLEMLYSKAYSLLIEQKSYRFKVNLNIKTSNLKKMSNVE